MYSLTKEEVTTYAEWGGDASWALSFASACAGFAGGCVISLIQGTHGAAVLLLRGVGVFSGIVALLGIWWGYRCLARQQRCRQDWEQRAFRASMVPKDAAP